MERTRRDVEVELGTLIRNARKALGLTQDQVVELVSVAADKRISQNKVSDHERGVWGRGAIEDYVGAYGRVLRISEDQLREVLGFTPVGAERPPPSFAEIVRGDPTLDQASKDHIISQYALLQAASRHNRAHPSAATG